MRKYLEYFSGDFDSTVAEKMKPENQPYVCFSATQGVGYTLPSKPVTGPSANEIWYTSTNGEVVTPENVSMFGANVTSNIYENGKGIITFDGPIVKLSDNAFYYCDTITSITIPEGVTTFSDNSFYEAQNIQSIVIPSTITRIGHGSFFNCISLENVTFNGTMDQWNSISKGQSWKYNMLTTVIHCSDGDIAL